MKNMPVSKQLSDHVVALRLCRRCARMFPPVVSGGPVVSRVILVGQAPGDKEPVLGRPFAWTAGKRLFRWLQEATGWDEPGARASIYFAAVCRCFPGKKPSGGDRVPSPDEVINCAAWLDREIDILAPALVIPVGKLAIEQFVPVNKLEDVVGKMFTCTRGGLSFDVIPLPHPSGASPWCHQTPGKTLLRKALQLIAAHAAIHKAV